MFICKQQRTCLISGTLALILLLFMLPMLLSQQVSPSKSRSTGKSPSKSQQRNTKHLPIKKRGKIHHTVSRVPRGDHFRLRALANACTASGVNFAYHGGALLKHPQIQVIFWGTQWDATSINTVTDKITRLVNSPYLTKIYPEQISCPALLQFYWDNSGAPQSASSQDVENEVDGLIAAGNKVISPDANPDNAYLVIAPGVGFSDGAYGYHTWEQLASGTYVHYAIVDNYDLGNNTSFDQVTQTFSHELAELISDPLIDASPGISGDNDGVCGQQPCEIGDACSCFDTVQTNVAVSYYYSLDNGGCVLPDGANGCHAGTPTPSPTPSCKTCADLGANCGQVDDGCGNKLQCGQCTAPNMCGGGGTPNVCGCTPSKENPCDVATKPRL